jgi:Tfp pilus assembly major pilin PilA
VTVVVVFLAGIAMAIAIPAYQSYRIKADAAKSTAFIEVPTYVVPAAQRHVYSPENPVLVRAIAARA